MVVRVSSLLSAMLNSGPGVEERPNRAEASGDCRLGESDRDRNPDNVVDLEATDAGLEGRKRSGLGRMGDSFRVGDRAFRTSSGCSVEMVSAGPGDASPCEVMD